MHSLTLIYILIHSLKLSPLFIIKPYIIIKPHMLLLSYKN